MADSALESLLKRDRRIAISAIAVLTLLAWLYLVWLARSMDMTGPAMPAMPDMPDMPGMNMAGPLTHSWTVTDFLFMFVMWTVMMAGMMTPSAAPMLLIYARVARQSAQSGKPLAATGWFAGGYLLSWSIFSLAATAVQGLMVRAAWLTPGMAAASGKAAGLALVAAGIYQWTPLKESCLRHCQSPFAFIQSHGGFKGGFAGSIRLGLQHGLYCIGCCWALMALLFAGGVMNIVWIAAIAIFVLLEKVVPAGRWIARVAGAGLVAAGLFLIFRG